MAQPDYSNRNENRYMWWIETPGRLNSATTHSPGIAIAYQSFRDGAIYSPVGSESFYVQYVKQAEVGLSRLNYQYNFMMLLFHMLYQKDMRNLQKV